MARKIKDKDKKKKVIKQKQKQRQTVNVKVHIDQSKRTVKKGSSSPQEKRTSQPQIISIPQFSNPVIQPLQAPPAVPVSNNPINISNVNVPPQFSNILPNDNSLGNSVRRPQTEPMETQTEDIPQTVMETQTEDIPLTEPIEQATIGTQTPNYIHFPKNDYTQTKGKIYNPYSGLEIGINYLHLPTYDDRRAIILKFNIENGYYTERELLLLNPKLIETLNSKDYFSL